MAATLKDVLDFIRNPELDRNDRLLIVEALNSQVRAKRAQAKQGLHRGMRVEFYSNRAFKNVIGRIQKVNRVNVDLIEEGTGMQWRVSPGLLKPVA
jgi:hypothetical protein